MVESFLCLSEGCGCDPAPIDVSTQEGALALLSYIWPDELDRLARIREAITIARAHPAIVEAAGAVAWVERRLAKPHPGRLTIVWQSVMRQYLGETERRQLEDRIEEAGTHATDERPLAWVALEPGDDHLSNFTITCVAGRREGGHHRRQRRPWPAGQLAARTSRLTSRGRIHLGVADGVSDEIRVERQTCRMKRVAVVGSGLRIIDKEVPKGLPVQTCSYYIESGLRRQPLGGWCRTGRHSDGVACLDAGAG